MQVAMQWMTTSAPRESGQSSQIWDENDSFSANQATDELAWTTLSIVI